MNITYHTTITFLLLVLTNWEVPSSEVVNTSGWAVTYVRDDECAINSAEE